MDGFKIAYGTNPLFKTFRARWYQQILAQSHLDKTSSGFFLKHEVRMLREKTWTGQTCNPRVDW